MGYYTVTKDKFPHSVTMSEYHKKKLTAMHRPIDTYTYRMVQLLGG